MGPSRGPCESLPQALEASVEGTSLCSKASFVLLLASLHNLFLLSGLQTQVLRVLGGGTVSRTEVAGGKWSGVAEGWHLPPSVPCSQSSGSLTTPDIWGNSHLLTGSGCAAFRAQSWTRTRREGGLDALTLAGTA